MVGMEPRICKECGKLFTPKNGMSKYCDGAHHRTCVVCGKDFEVTRAMLSNGDTRKTCSRECSAQLRKTTNESKYGGPAPACSDIVQNKMQSSNLARYGVKHGAQSEQGKQKTIQTNLDKYGCKYYSQSPKYKDQITEYWSDPDNKSIRSHRIASSNFDRYGVNCTFSLQKVRDKCKSTMKARYGGEYTYECPDLLAKAQATTEAVYGVKFPLQNMDLQTKAKNTCKEKYGVDNIFQLASLKDSKTKLDMVDSSKFDVFQRFRDDPKAVISDMRLDHKPGPQELCSYLGVTASTIYYYIHINHCEDLFDWNTSTTEREVTRFLAELIPGIEIIMHDRNILSGYEIDIYLPQYQIGIECNPTCTHNSSFADPCGSAPKPSDYHNMKTNVCEKEGIRLIHIFGYEWTYKRDIIESILRSALGVIPDRIYARGCDVKELDSKICSEFLEHNHRQGSVNSKYRYGLFYHGELVSVMTFSKMRPTIGTGNEDLDDCYELVRFCNKLNTTVVGGASKLFKHFIRTVNPARVRSFSDRAHTTGNLYEKLSFTEHHRSSPGYMWVDLATDKAYSRINAQKHNIKKFLNDDNIDLTKSESQIMAEHGFAQVFDSGRICWEWVC